MIHNFTEGQLVAAVGKTRLAKVYVDHKHGVPFNLRKATFNPRPDNGDECWGTQGNVMDADAYYIPVDALKPVVHYHGKLPQNFIITGERASIRVAEDHYAGCGMVGGELVSTSAVLNYDEATGVFETRNTMYVPKEI